MGRADQTTKVRGMFVHPRRWPMCCAAIRKSCARAWSSAAPPAPTAWCSRPSRARGEDLAKRIADSLRDLTKLRGDVEWVDVGGLPNDGKVIDDVRTYE